MPRGSRGRHSRRTGASPYALGVARADLDKQPTDVRRMFDAVAQRYDVTNDVLSLGQDRRWRNEVIDAVAPAAGRAGPRPRGRHRHVEPAVRRRRRRPSSRATSRSGCSRSASEHRPHLPFTAGDGTRLPFADDTFDAVTISFGLRNIVDPDAGLARDAPRDPARRPAGGLRVQPPDVGAVPDRLRRVPDEGAARRSPGPSRSSPDAYVYLAESIRAWPDQAGAGRADRAAPAGSARSGATSPAASSPCTAPPPERALGRHLGHDRLR